MTHPQSNCDICECALQRGIADWHFVCPSCGTECSTLQGTFDERPVELDEPARRRGLAPLRHDGYRLILDELRRCHPHRGALLEVGCGHGWFLELASSEYEKVVGIEPDAAVRSVPGAENVEIRDASFPDGIVPGETFAVIAFNDVFEHIPQPRASCDAIHRALQDDGMVAINIPVRDGFIYRTSSLLYRAGLRGPFERMWQKDFPSPHLYYFSARSLQALFAHSGFDCERAFAMPTLRVRGLWSRIRYAQQSVLAAFIAYVAAIAILPLLRVFPADVRCFLFRARGINSEIATTRRSASQTSAPALRPRA